MTDPKIFVAVPIYGAVPTQFMSALMHLQADPPARLQIALHPGDSLVSRARNQLTARFLKSDCTHLLFLDSDLIFSPEHIARLLGHGEDVVAGFYPKKKQDGEVEWVCNAKTLESKADERGLQEVRYMGTGFMLIARRVIEAMVEAHGKEIAYRLDYAPDETEWDLWPVGVYKYPDGGRRYLSEDWYFCQRWLDLGGRVFGDTLVVLKHVGQAVYPLASQWPLKKAEEPVQLTDAKVEEILAGFPGEKP